MKNNCKKCGKQRAQKRSTWCSRCIHNLERARKRRGGAEYLPKTGTGQRRIRNSASLYGSIINYRKVGPDKLMAVVRGNVQGAHSRLIRFVGTVQRSADLQRKEFLCAFARARKNALTSDENRATRVPLDL